MTIKENMIFALDIGTRSIVGILLEESSSGFIVQEIIVKEHSSRSMLDGQIHNIPEVTALVKEVKEEMEKKTGVKIKKVAVAAAGRSLKTIKTKVCHDFDEFQISQDDVLMLELRGAQKAQALLLEENKKDSNYYCVGYSVTNFFLDNAMIGNLIGQKGKIGCVELVAAFLPKIVVDSLQTVLDDNDLDLSNITLEPIAAINVILPPSMRKLNVALVDVGAGTSDIAISSNGSIIAYGMVPLAGDEITEMLSEKYLLDFNEGESVKRRLQVYEKVNFTNILGFPQDIKVGEIIESISENIEILAKNISDEIIKLNNKSPQAVLLIGGGSQTPLLPKYIADYLGLPKERVAVQNAFAVKDIFNLPEEFSGPEIITPLGIGITALKYTTLSFIPVEVNGKSINLLNMGKNKVSDALLTSGLNRTKLYGKPGLALTFEVNGELKMFTGTLGKVAVVKINDEIKSLDTVLNPKDNIEFIPAEDGEIGKAIIRDIIPNAVNFVWINNEKKVLPFEIIMNGQVVKDHQEIYDGSKIYYREIRQVGELLNVFQYIGKESMANIQLLLNGKKQNLTIISAEIKSNGTIIDLYDDIEPQSKITVQPIKHEKIIENIIKKHILVAPKKFLEVKVNEETTNIPLDKLEVKLNGNKLLKEVQLNEGDILEINYDYKNTNPMLLDIFKVIDFPTMPPNGKSRLNILVNNLESEYTTPLKDGDQIQLIWQ